MQHRQNVFSVCPHLCRYSDCQKNRRKGRWRARRRETCPRLHTGLLVKLLCQFSPFSVVPHCLLLSFYFPSLYTKLSSFNSFIILVAVLQITSNFSLHFFNDVQVAKRTVIIYIELYQLLYHRQADIGGLWWDTLRSGQHFDCYILLYSYIGLSVYYHLQLFMVLQQLLCKTKSLVNQPSSCIQFYFSSFNFLMLPRFVYCSIRCSYIIFTVAPKNNQFLFFYFSSFIQYISPGTSPLKIVFKDKWLLFSSLPSIDFVGSTWTCLLHR